LQNLLFVLRRKHGRDIGGVALAIGGAAPELVLL